jgi:FdhD protein
VPTAIAGEHPLTLYLDKRELVTLMTLGGAPEALVIGWLRNQRMLPSVEDIVGAGRLGRECRCGHHDAKASPTSMQRMASKTVTTGCGQGTVFGDLMDDIDRSACRPMRD